MSDYYPPSQNQPSQYGYQSSQYEPAPQQLGPRYRPAPGQPVPGYGLPSGAPNAPYSPAQQAGANGMSITGFILGLVSIMLAWIPIISMIGMITAVLGIIFSAIGMRLPTSNRGLAIAGLVLSILAVTLSLGMLLFFASLISILAI